MKNPFSRTPFLFLLLPLLAGIVLQRYVDIHHWSIALLALLAFLMLGGSLMLLSFFIPRASEYRWRWLFGFGAISVVVAIGSMSALLSQHGHNTISAPNPASIGE